MLPTTTATAAAAATSYWVTHVMGKPMGGVGGGAEVVVGDPLEAKLPPEEGGGPPSRTEVKAKPKVGDQPKGSPRKKRKQSWTCWFGCWKSLGMSL